MTSKPQFVGEKVKLGSLIKPAKVERCGKQGYPILSITKDDGIVLQSAKFKKRIASKDTASYKVVPRGKLIQGIHIDEANFAIQNLFDWGIVSPAYKIWDIDTAIVDPEYLALALRSESSLAYYRRNLVGTVHRRGRMSNEAFYRLEVNLPSLQVQKRILAILGDAASQIAYAQQQIAQLDSLVKSRFVEMFGDLKENRNGWPVERFDSFAIIDTHMTTDFDSYAEKPHIGIDSIESISGRLAGYRTVAEDGIVSGKYPFTDAHIIYSKIRPALNKVALPDFDGVCSADAYPILPVPEKCNRIYLAHVLRSNFFLDYVLPLSGRAQMPKVNKKALWGFSMPLPSLALQQKFAAFVQQVDKSRFIAQQQIEKLQMLYDSLAQEYFGD